MFHKCCQAFLKVHKTYIALIQGKLEETTRTIEAPLSPDRPPKQKVDFTIGKPSTTLLRVILPNEEQYGLLRNIFPAGPEDAECTLVELQPLTGR